MSCGRKEPPLQDGFNVANQLIAVTHRLRSPAAHVDAPTGAGDRRPFLRTHLGRGESRDVTMDCIDNQTAEDDAQVTEGVPAAVQVATDRAKAEARKISDERRAHRRVPGRALDWINVARVKYGPEVNIVDLSRGGGTAGVGSAAEARLASGTRNCRS